MRTLAGIGPRPHVKDLKTGANEPVGHAVGGPVVGGGHRVGKGFTVRTLKEPHEECSAGSKAATKLPQRSLKILWPEMDEGVPGEDPADLPVVGPEVGERRDLRAYVPGPEGEPLTVFSVRTYC